jgi:hypothetical protein
MDCPAYLYAGRAQGRQRVAEVPRGGIDDRRGRGGSRRVIPRLAAADFPRTARQRVPRRHR